MTTAMGHGLVGPKARAKGRMGNPWSPYTLEDSYTCCRRGIWVNIPRHQDEGGSLFRFQLGRIRVSGNAHER